METEDLPDDDELTLAIWENSEEALAKLLMKNAGNFEKFVKSKYPSFDAPTVEDIVSEGIRRFWLKRTDLDTKRSLAGFVYGFIKNVAREHAGCSINWQKVRQREITNVKVLPDKQAEELEDRLDEIEEQNAPLLEALKQVLADLNPMHRAVWEAYALSRDNVNAGELGFRLGIEYRDGKPIPANTIRGTRKRVYEKVQMELRNLGFDLDQLGRKR